MAPGGWGTALAVLCCRKGHDVILWGAFENEIENIKNTHENPLLKGIEISDKISLTTDISSVSDSDIVIMATPSFAVRETAAKLKGVIGKDTVVVSVTKGFEKGSLKRFSVVIKEELPDNEVVVLSGPSHAEEVARRIPTSVVSASENLKAAEYIQEALMDDTFRIYTNTDVIGVETGAALKNIIAMAAGVCDGMGLGDNTVAALITRGINEMAALGIKMGADRFTFAGLSGIGDLVVTCTSRHSRNRSFGKALGSGMSVDEALKSVGMTVESYYATASAKQLADKYGVEMPIINECYDLLYNGANVKDAIKNLMNRSMKPE
ncbi:MAG: NAD(P)-dependent glycerol-3-phosphate dehydrogenase [Clostridia bacterium]|nr:NAD(P)-dependent glycerol-3-phosphate dehydrogenase [Clostridia bacterium]